MPKNDKPGSWGRQWRRHRMKYYFIGSIGLVILLLLINLAFVRRYFY